MLSPLRYEEFRGEPGYAITFTKKEPSSPWEDGFNPQFPQVFLTIHISSDQTDYLSYWSSQYLQDQYLPSDGAVVLGSILISPLINRLFCKWLKLDTSTVAMIHLRPELLNRQTIGAACEMTLWKPLHKHIWEIPRSRFPALMEPSAPTCLFGSWNLIDFVFLHTKIDLDSLRADVESFTVTFYNQSNDRSSQTSCPLRLEEAILLGTDSERFFYAIPLAWKEFRPTAAAVKNYVRKLYRWSTKEKSSDSSTVPAQILNGRIGIGPMDYRVRFCLFCDFYGG